MNHLGNAVLGLIFVAVGAAASFLMFYLWGYPFNHATHKSGAPPRLMLLHRVLGYVYAGIFIYLMVQMVPRLWTYQIELPARTVAHLVIGLVIGITLLIKIVIVRFFKHLESTLAPFLGTLLLICTVVLIGLSVPTALREVFASRGDTFLPANVERVRAQFALANIEGGQNLSADNLRAGRAVMSARCIACHDLRTVLARPRTARDWRSTVQRMAERSLGMNPIGERDQFQVVAYLVAISPDLQGAAQARRQHEQMVDTSHSAVQRMDVAQPSKTGFDTAEARRLFESKCSQCHALRLPDKSTVKTPEDARDLVGRMVMNGLSATDGELRDITMYITQAVVK